MERLSTLYQDNMEAILLLDSYRHKPSMPLYNRLLCLAMAKEYALIGGRAEDAALFQKEIEDVLIKGYLEYVEKHLKKDDDLTLPAGQIPS